MNNCLLIKIVIVQKYYCKLLDINIAIYEFVNTNLL